LKIDARAVFLPVESIYVVAGRIIKHVAKLPDIRRLNSRNHSWASADPVSSLHQAKVIRGQPKTAPEAVVRSCPEWWWWPMIGPPERPHEAGDGGPVSVPATRVWKPSRR